MFTLLIVLAIVGVLYGIVVLVGSMQPRIATLERTVLIDADLATVFPEVSNLRNFVTWSPWSEKDPAMQQTFTGLDGTVGSEYSWTGNRKVGKGKMTITAIDPGKRTDLAIDFGFSKAESAFVTAAAAGGQTSVTWKFSSDMGGNPTMRLMQPAMKKFIGKDYEAGLQNLKKKIEAGVKPVDPVPATPVDTTTENPVTPEPTDGTTPEPAGTSETAFRQESIAINKDVSHLHRGDA